MYMYIRPIQVFSFLEMRKTSDDCLPVWSKRIAFVLRSHGLTKTDWLFVDKEQGLQSKEFMTDC